jgi:hypothetical protein
MRHALRAPHRRFTRRHPAHPRDARRAEHRDFRILRGPLLWRALGRKWLVSRSSAVGSGRRGGEWMGSGEVPGPRWRARRANPPVGTDGRPSRAPEAPRPRGGGREMVAVHRLPVQPFWGDRALSQNHPHHCSARDEQGERVSLGVGLVHTRWSRVHVLRQHEIHVPGSRQVAADRVVLDSLDDVAPPAPLARPVRSGGPFDASMRFDCTVSTFLDVTVKLSEVSTVTRQRCVPSGTELAQLSITSGHVFVRLDGL